MSDNRADDDILDERIRALTAARYNAPEGSVPRDAMWGQIVAARRAARAGTTGAATEAPAREADVIPLAPRRRPRTIVIGWSALLAAGLVLGVVLERTVFHGEGRSPVQVATADSSRRDSVPTTSTPVDSQEASAPSVPVSPPATTPRSRDVTPRAPQSLAQGTPRTLPPLPDSTVQTFYRTAAMQTLAQAEACATRRPCSRRRAGRATSSRARGSSSIPLRGAIRRCAHCSPIWS
jgi:hypothetical protein